jgi:hypothetical protein
VLRESANAAAASTWRRVGLHCIVACIVLGGAAVGASAGQRPTPDAKELWRAFPLEQSPKAAGGQPARAPAPRRRAGPSSPAAQGPAMGPSPILLALVGAGGALLVLMAISLRRRRVSVSTGVRPDAGNAVVAPRTRPAPPGPGPGPDTRAPAEPTRPATRARPRTGNGASPASGRSAAARKGPVCQVRWSPSSARFYAVTAGADGVKHRVVRSSRVEWGEPTAPEETREAQAALRQLAKELRDRGWRPLRAKGIDFDERQWYARRFRWPTEAEAQKPVDGAQYHEAAERSRGEHGGSGS